MDEKVIRVFMVDDDEDDYVLTRDMLAEAVGARFELEWVDTYEAGLEAMEQAQHDVYLVDYRLGEQDGLELLRAAIASGCKVPIIMLTGRGDHAVDMAAMKAGAADYLDKGQLSAPLLERSIRYAIERQRAEERVEHLNLVLRAIRSVNQLITREKDRDRLLQGACDRLIETRGYHNAWSALLDEAGGLVTTAEAGLGKDFSPIVEQLKRGELTACWRRGLMQSKVVVTEDPPSACADCPLAMHYDGRGAVAIRLEHGEKVYGLLSASIPTDLTADEKEQGLFQEVAGDIAFALHSIELEERRQRAEESLRESEASYKELAESIADVFFAFDKDLRYTYWNKASEELTGIPAKDAIAKSLYDLFPDTPQTRKAEGVYRDVLRTQQPQTFVNEYQLEGKDFIFEISAYPSKRGLSVFVKDITERKRAEEELRQSFERLRRSLEGTVNVSVSAIEMKDPYTAGHQRRVTRLACAIANEMGLLEEQIEGLRMAGLIHDIGKITVPAEILSKPGQLNNFEWGIIKAHPQIGYDVLKTIDFPWPVAQIVLQHHERMDGSGYPAGLPGEEIMLEARILAIADVVEAMASHRPYRSALGIDKALEEITQNRGILYDPEVVDVCFKLFTEKGFTFE